MSVKLKLILSVLITAFIVIKPLAGSAQQDGNSDLNELFDRYSKEYTHLYPSINSFFCTLLVEDGTESFSKKVNDFYTNYQSRLQKINYESLSFNNKISYGILKDIIDRNLAIKSFPKQYLPVNQFDCWPITMSLYGSGRGNKNFKTVFDYDNWLARISDFSIWTDNAIKNLKKGVKAGVVLPVAIVEKVIPQLDSLSDSNFRTSIFYLPIRNMPEHFSEKDKTRLTIAYRNAIEKKLSLTYKKLGHFLKEEYLPHARHTSGIDAMPKGTQMYNDFIYYYTTTHQPSEGIYQLGLSEVSRLTSEIEQLKTSVGFNGTLQELFQFMRTNKQFMPFKTDSAVLNAYKDLINKIQPNLSKFFYTDQFPTFSIRKIENYRSMSAAPYYNGKVFYLPIPDPEKFNIAVWPMEAVFLHEAIPGHHYQLSTQYDNTSFSRFRRYVSIPVFVEGWALYAESLGSNLGCYTDPYQKIGALAFEMHRAIRLIVDVAIHTGKMSREEAVRYIMDHEALPEQVAVVEVERFMIMPGQALSYKLGELKIKELRNKYQAELGERFDLRNFHTALLKGGPMPLHVLEIYMKEWALSQ